MCQAGWAFESWLDDLEYIFSLRVLGVAALCCESPLWSLAGLTQWVVCFSDMIKHPVPTSEEDVPAWGAVSLGVSAHQWLC